MAWFWVLIAGLLEVAWTVGLKYSEGFTRLVPSLLTVVALVLSGWTLALGAKTLPIGSAYAVWVGIGVCGSAIVGTALFREPMSLARGLFLALLVLAIMGLKLTTPSSES